MVGTTSHASLLHIGSMTNFRGIRRAILAGTFIAVAGCHGVLDVTDPTLIRDSDIANASGANAQRLNASSIFVSKILNPIRDVAYFTDEWTRDVPIGTDVTTDPSILLDLRSSEQIEQTTDHLAPLETAFWKTSLAISAVRAYTPDSLRGDFLAQLYGIRGYLIVQMAEDICPGFPINDVADNRTVYSGPWTTDSAMGYASAQLDSALKYVRDSARFETLARVVKGRALLDVGKYSEAAVMVASVPTAAEYNTEQDYLVPMSTFYCPECYVTALGNHEGGNGLPFASANDPRIPLRRLGVSRADSTDTLYVTLKGREEDHLVIASGIEARLIQAEAALQAGQSWKPILDTLRVSVGLDTLIDPGTLEGRVDLVYSERAFWLFMTGRRLGDLRRLIRNYARNPETVFPSGVWHGGTGDHYGTATAIPFNATNQERYNPKITAGCTSR